MQRSRPTLPRHRPTGRDTLQVRKGERAEAHQSRARGDARADARSSHRRRRREWCSSPPQKTATSTSASNALSAKSPETTEKLSEIKEMSGDREGLRRAGREVRPEGTAMAAAGGVINFARQEGDGARFGDNPYDEGSGRPGTFMRVPVGVPERRLDRRQHLRKLGMVLTILGLSA